MEFAIIRGVAAKPPLSRSAAASWLDKRGTQMFLFSMKPSGFGYPAEAGQQGASDE